MMSLNSATESQEQHIKQKVRLLFYSQTRRIFHFKLGLFAAYSLTLHRKKIYKGAYFIKRKITLIFIFRQNYMEKYLLGIHSLQSRHLKKLWKFWWVLNILFCSGIVLNTYWSIISSMPSEISSYQSDMNSHQFAKLFSLFFLKLSTYKIIWERN